MTARLRGAAAFVGLLCVTLGAPAMASDEEALAQPTSATEYTLAPTRGEPNPIKAQPSGTMSWSTNATTATAAAAVIQCVGNASPPDITLGGPGQRFITGTASQQCSGSVFVQELCAKIQRNSGGLDPTWLDVTNWQCNTNTGPSIYATATRDCAVSAYAQYRTGARATATPPGLPTQRRYYYSAARWLC